MSQNKLLALRSTSSDSVGEDIAFFCIFPYSFITVTAGWKDAFSSTIGK